MKQEGDKERGGDKALYKKGETDRQIEACRAFRKTELLSVNLVQSRRHRHTSMIATGSKREEQRRKHRKRHSLPLQWHFRFNVCPSGIGYEIAVKTRSAVLQLGKMTVDRRVRGAPEVKTKPHTSLWIDGGRLTWVCNLPAMILN